MLVILVRVEMWSDVLMVKGECLHGQRQSAVISGNHSHRCHFYYRSKKDVEVFTWPLGQNTPPPATHRPAPNPPMSIIIPDPHESGIS